MLKTKTQTNVIKSFLHSSGLAAAAIVLLVVSVGAVLLPNSSALIAAPVVTATPTNDANYGATIKWSGANYYQNWDIKVMAGNQLFNEQSAMPYIRGTTVSGLVCNQTYTVLVAQVDSRGTALSSYGSTTVVTQCGQAAMTSLTTDSNSVITASWQPVTKLTSGYILFLKAGNGAYDAGTHTTSKTLTTQGACGTTYTAYVVGKTTTQSGPASGTLSVTTPACPAAPVVKAATPAPVKSVTKAPTPTVKKKATTPAKVTAPAAAAPAPTPAPAMPANFAAEVQSDKLVELSWDALTGNVDHYQINRSTDNATWVPLSTTKADSYEDNSTDFATTYYYQLGAVDSNNQVSGFATAQVTTNKFTSSASTVKSADKSVAVKIPTGAVSQTYNCTLSSNEASLKNIPLGQHVLAGPYNLHCIGGDGKLITNFSKPITVSINATAAAKNYANLSAQTSTKQGWNTVQSAKYDPKTKQITFTLTAAKTIAVFGQKKKNLAAPIIGSLLFILLAAAAVIGWIFWRRRQPPPAVAAAAAVQERTAEEEFRHALAAPDCTHKSLARPVTPSSAGCYECQRDGTHWKALRICLICGHVGCSDDSDQQHALKHYQETGHPIVYDYADPAAGNSIGWCYTDKTYI